MPPTADDRTFRHRIIQGEVQDENAKRSRRHCPTRGPVLHGRRSRPIRARHAQRWLSDPAPGNCPNFFRAENPRPKALPGRSAGTRPRPSQSGNISVHALLDISVTRERRCGSIPRQLSITLLTNRTWPDCQNQEIKQVRPAFHDAVIEAFEGKVKESLKRKTNVRLDLRRLGTEKTNSPPPISIARSRSKLPHYQY
jgi:serine-type D-Ala-D-Ala carboxypeptidase